jgi:prepilin-type N-terminal cleavage/methylation domain-containing protein
MQVPQPERYRAQSGFTLIELMAVVIIIGILAAVAVPAYRHYTIQARTTEATTLLPQIRLKMENYFLEFRNYPACTAHPSNYTNIASGQPEAWTPEATWTNIGFSPPNPSVYFQYQVNSGTNATSNLTGNDRNCFGLINPNAHYPTGSGDIWYTICARGNLRGDTNHTSRTDPGMVFGMSSSSVLQRVFVNTKR